MPDTFNFKRNYRRIDCDEPGYEGFWIKVRAGISNDERDALREARREGLEYNIAYLNMEPVERAAIDASGDTPRRREFALAAPFIVGWNAVGETDAGEEKPLPPPAEAGPDIFACVPVDIFIWMFQLVVDGYVASGKAMTSQPVSMPASGPQIVPMPDADERKSRRQANS